jgi:hypothetical protein
MPQWLERLPVTSEVGVRTLGWVLLVHYVFRECVLYPSFSALQSQDFGLSEGVEGSDCGHPW